MNVKDLNGTGRGRFVYIRGALCIYKTSMQHKEDNALRSRGAFWSKAAILFDIMFGPWGALLICG